MADPDSPHMKRSVTDRASEVSPLVWLMLGVLAVLLFIGLMAVMSPFG